MAVTKRETSYLTQVTVARLSLIDSIYIWQKSGTPVFSTPSPSFLQCGVADGEKQDDGTTERHVTPVLHSQQLCTSILVTTTTGDIQVANTHHITALLVQQSLNQSCLPRQEKRDISLKSVQHLDPGNLSKHTELQVQQ